LSAITLDVSKFPIVVATYPAKYTLADLDAHFSDVKKMMAGGQPYTMITDLRAASGEDAQMRKRATDFAKETAELSSKLCRGACVVVSSKLMKLAVQAILAFSRTAFPQVVLEDIAEAHKWCLQRAQA